MPQCPLCSSTIPRCPICSDRRQPPHANLPNPNQNHGAPPSATDPEILGEWRIDDPETILQELQKQHTEAERSEAQNALDDSVQSGRHRLRKRWVEELDTLLVYAALFSAVLTAFNVESYRLLKPDDAAAESVVSAMKELSVHLRHIALNDSARAAAESFGTPQEDASVGPVGPPTFVVVVNCLWFTSLILSLASASIALLVKQWLYESRDGNLGWSRLSTQLLQYRMNAIKRWKVREITVLVPFLLQVALVIFLVGLVILLWNLHPVVAAVSSAFTGSFILFFGVVTVLPSYQWDCCYRAPQALLVYTLVRAIRNKITDFLQWCIIICFNHTNSKFWLARLWWSTLQKLCGILSRAPEYPTWHWRVRERLELRKQSGALNIGTAVAAYRLTLDPLHLDHMRISLSAAAKAPLARCLLDLGAISLSDKEDRPHQQSLLALDVGVDDGEKSPDAPLRQDVRKRLSNIALTALWQMFTIDKGKSRDESWELKVQRLFSMYTGTVSAETAPQSELVLKVAFYIAMEATSPSSRFTALHYLASAINVDSQTPCDYHTVSRVLSAAEQWIEKQQLHVEGQQQITAASHVIIAFSIVVHCMLRVETKKTPVPDPGHLLFRQRTSKALGSLPGLLPIGMTIHESKTEIDAVVFGLQLLLGPLTRLSESIEVSSQEIPQTPVSVIHESVVSHLEYVWNVVEAVLEWHPLIPTQESDDTSSGGITERLTALRDKVKTLFPQGVEGMPNPHNLHFGNPSCSGA